MLHLLGFVVALAPVYLLAYMGYVVNKGGKAARQN
jgi:hypothetical protein